MNPSFLLVIATLLTAQAESNEDGAKLKQAKKQAQVCVDAMTKEDFEKMMDLTHPKVVESLGGREAAVKAAKKAVDDLNDLGISFVSAIVGSPHSLTRAGVDLWCVVPTTLKAETPKGKLSLNGFLIAFSGDGGKSWLFLDGAPGEDRLRKLVSEIPKDLKFPEPQKPKLDEDDKKK